MARLGLALVLALAAAAAQAAPRRRIFPTLYRPEDAPQYRRNLFHPPHSDRLPNRSVFTGPRGADGGSLAQLEQQLGCYGDGPCGNRSEGFGIADAVMGGGCEAHPATCAAAFTAHDWWLIGSIPGTPGDSHANATPAAEAHRLMGERYLGAGMAEYDGGYVWQQQQDLFPNPSSSDRMFERHLNFFSFQERYVEAAGSRLNQMITNMMGAHYPVKSGMYSMTAGETARARLHPTQPGRSWTLDCC